MACLDLTLLRVTIKIKQKGKKINEEMAAKVARVVAFLKNFPRMRAEAPAETEALPLGAEQNGTLSL